MASDSDNSCTKMVAAGCEHLPNISKKMRKKMEAFHQQQQSGNVSPRLPTASAMQDSSQPPPLVDDEPAACFRDASPDSSWMLSKPEEEGYYSNGVDNVSTDVHSAVARQPCQSKGKDTMLAAANIQSSANLGYTADCDTPVGPVTQVESLLSPAHPGTVSPSSTDSSPKPGISRGQMISKLANYVSRPGNS